MQDILEARFWKSGLRFSHTMPLTVIRALIQDKALLEEFYFEEFSLYSPFTKKLETLVNV